MVQWYVERRKSKEEGRGRNVRRRVSLYVTVRQDNNKTSPFFSCKMVDEVENIARLAGETTRRVSATEIDLPFAF